MINFNTCFCLDHCGFSFLKKYLIINLPVYLFVGYTLKIIPNFCEVFRSCDPNSFFLREILVCFRSLILGD